MRLTKSDKQILHALGYHEEDFDQIGRAAGKTTYTLKDKVSKPKKLTIAETRKLLGDEAYFSGLGRSAFHFTGVIQVGCTEKYIYFDSSRFFEG